MARLGLDETHDPKLRSWVESANRSGCDFPIQNLPLGVYRAGSKPQASIGVAIGDFILDAGEWLPGETLNAYMGLPASQRRDLRHAFSRALRKGSSARELIHQADCEMLLPAKIGDFTDFYASIHHAMNVGKMFRPDNPLLPNYRHVPIAYHGRASSVVVSDTPIRRPVGQLGEGRFEPTQELDYEVELGAFVGPGNEIGRAISISDAREHLAGVCLLNDWSARDIQRWEYQPLGPFLAKNFATSISPWVITADALQPFRTAPPEHEIAPLAYLQDPGDGAYDITLEVWLRPHGTAAPERLSTASFRDMYWTLSQMIAHHTSNGCPLRAGDLIGTGTVSGPEKQNRGCLLELTWKGFEACTLASGQTRLFLENGDEVILKGYCVREGFVQIGFGACQGVIQPPYEPHGN